MSEHVSVRWGWLKARYIYTAVVAGGFGLGIVLIPGIMISLFRWPGQNPLVFGVTGSVYLSFAVLSILGLRSPLKFVPVLLLQLFYKSIWLVGVVLPLLVAGRLPVYSILPIAIFVTAIVGDIVAIPFSYLLAKEPCPLMKST